ncbi:peptigoglycan-binding protein LysM, partial [Paenibacillus macerans]
NQSKQQDDKHQKNSDAKTTEGSLDDRYDEAQLQQQHDKSQQQNKTEKQSQDNRMKDGKDAAIVNGTSESPEHKSKSTQNRPGPKAQQQKRKSESTQSKPSTNKDKKAATGAGIAGAAAG